MKKVIETDVELGASEMLQLEAFARKLARQRKAKMESEAKAVPEGKRVYVLDIKQDSIMTDYCGKHALIVKGKKEAEYIIKQLERKFGKKFYMEETARPINKLKI